MPKHKDFDRALKIFVESFKTPRFNCELVSQEILNIEEEFQNQMKNDRHRLHQLEKSEICRPGCAINSSITGSQTSLER